MSLDGVLHGRTVFHRFLPWFRWIGFLPYGSDGLLSPRWTRHSVVFLAAVLLSFAAYKSVVWRKIDHDTVTRPLTYVKVIIVESAPVVAHWFALVLRREDMSLVVASLRSLIEGTPADSQPRTWKWLVAVAATSAFKLLIAYESRAIFLIMMSLEELTFWLAVFHILLYSFLLNAIRGNLAQLVDQLTPHAATIVSLTEAHQRLIDNCHSVNRFYSWFMLFFCTRVVFQTVIYMFFMLSVLGGKFEPHGLKEVSYTFTFSFGLCAIKEFFTLFLLCSSCEETKYQADNFNKRLFNIMMDSKDLCSHDRLQIYVRMKQTVNFTAAGFFHIGYPLMTSILAGVTTYLVILFQFRTKE